jgi:hypothetical protein
VYAALPRKALIWSNNDFGAHLKKDAHVSELNLDQ